MFVSQVITSKKKEMLCAPEILIYLIFKNCSELLLLLQLMSEDIKFNSLCFTQSLYNFVLTLGSASLCVE